jgi:hypothetical protein
LLSQVTANEPVALFVARDFRVPEGDSGLRHSAMPSATVPEAAVHEDSKPGQWESEVRAAGKWLVAAPTGDAGRSKHRGELHLRRFIAARANGCHNFAAFSFC